MKKLVATFSLLFSVWGGLSAEEMQKEQPDADFGSETDEHVVILDTICEGNTYVFAGKNIDKGGVYSDTVVVDDKRTITELHLTIGYGSSVAVRATIQSGDVYQFGSKALTMGGTYVDTLVSAAGCDSIVTLFLKEMHEMEDCDNLVTLFLEDFGGNNPADAVAKGSGIPQCSYNYNDNPKGSGNYAIRKVGWNHNQWYYPFYDHTYPGDGARGYMLQADGSSRPGAFYQTQIDGLCEGSLVYVYFWGCSATATNFGDNAYLSLVVTDTEGNELGKKDVTLFNRRGYWEEYGMFVRVPANTSSIVYKVTNNSGTASGNDFFLDDVGVAICVPPTQLEQPSSVCRGSKYQFNGGFENEGIFQEPLNYRWLYSQTGDLNTDWQILTETAIPVYSIDGVSDEHAGYYRLAVGAKGDLDKPNCMSMSDPVLIVVDDCHGPHVTTADDYYDVLACKAPFTFDILDNDDIFADGYDVTLLGESTVLGNSATISNGKLVYSVGSVSSSSDVLTYVVRAGNLSDTAKVSIHLSASVDTSVNVTICEGDTFKMGGSYYTLADSYTVHLTSKDGCDSIVSLNLMVTPKVAEDLSQSICEGKTFAFAGLLLDAAGTYSDTTMSQLGCDSVTNLTLTVLPTVYNTVYDTVCLADVVSEDSVFRTVFTSHYGCDSVYTRNVHYLPTFVVNEEAVVCDGAAYEWNGMTLTEAGRYKANLTSSLKCDSVVELELKVSVTQRQTISNTICIGRTYRFKNQDLSVAGVYTDTLVSASGCDSIVTLNLSVAERVITSIDHSMCKGETFQFAEHAIASPGVYTEVFTSSVGCDSVVTLNLTVNEPAIVEVNDTVCAGEEYEFANETKVYNSGNVTLVSRSQTQTGCDSVTTLHLMVLPTGQSTIFDTVMVSECYARNGFDLGVMSAVGDASHSLNTNNALGCDSVVTLNLHVLPLVDNHLIPTAFSPSNYDGSNDVFMKGYDVYVYDRYGNLVCHSSDGWDGRYQGGYADPGVYVYVITMKDGKKRKGTIEVLKN